MKADNLENKGISDEALGSADVLNFGLRVFADADKEDRDGSADR